MIRFVDLRGQSTGYRFAWYSTGTNHFLTFADEQVWDTWAECLDDMRAMNTHPDQIRRLQNLVPEWALVPPTSIQEMADFEDAEAILLAYAPYPHLSGPIERSKWVERINAALKKNGCKIEHFIDILGAYTTIEALQKCAASLEHEEKN